MEIEDKVSIGPLFRDIVQTGAAFGAQRWLGSLQRACERCASLSSLGGMHADIAGGTCLSLNPSSYHWFYF
jgi:homeobox-leucine zipper protein